MLEFLTTLRTLKPVKLSIIQRRMCADKYEFRKHIL